jgi:hypothetical protein
MSSYEPVPDPFMSKGPIPIGAQGFYERAEVFTHVEELLRAGESVSLVGERKAGKTSFLNYLQTHLSDDEFIPVFVDAQLIQPKTDKMFLVRLVRTAAQAIEDATDLTDPIETKTPAAQADEAYTAFEEDLDRLRPKLPLNSDGKKRRLVWLIDEIEVLRGYDGTQLFTFLRPFAQSDLDFRMVVAGYDVLYTLSNRSAWSPFFNAFRDTRLEGLNPVVAQQLVDDARQKMGVVIDSELYEPILQWTGQKPFYLKWMMSKLADALNHQQTDHRVSPNILKATKRLFLAETDLVHHFNLLWSHLTERQQTVLSLIAPQQGPYNHPTILEELKEKKQLGGDKQETQHLIDDLIRLKQLGFLYEQVGRYTFTSGCLHDFLKESKPL